MQISLSDDPVIGPQLDITAPAMGVEVEVRGDGKVLWVNVDGILRLRVCQSPRLTIVGQLRPDRAEAIRMHQHLLNMHRHMRKTCQLDVFAEAQDHLIEVLNDEIEYLSNIDDARYQELMAV